uniref:U17-Austrotoxin-Ht1b_1 n=1 Tax=Hickmania troglodytes TaxID=489260 RepID=A0A482Z6N5_9ARAC
MKVFMCLALLSALVIVTQASSDEIEQAGYLSADWDSFLNATSEIDWNAVKDEINDKLNNRNKCTGKGCGGRRPPANKPPPPNKPTIRRPGGRGGRGGRRGRRSIE